MQLLASFPSPLPRGGRGSERLRMRPRASAVYACTAAGRLSERHRPQRGRSSPTRAGDCRRGTYATGAGRRAGHSNALRPSTRRGRRRHTGTAQPRPPLGAAEHACATTGGRRQWSRLTAERRRRVSIYDV